MNIRNIIRLAQVMNEHGLTEVEIKEADSSVRLSRAVNAAGAAPHAAGGFTAALTIDQEEKDGNAAAEEAAEAAPDAAYITAPMPGTFFASAAPGDAPYVTEGSAVTPQTVVCIVEAMKVMNEVKAECSGTIARVLVENGTPVEYGQRLFEIR